MSGFLSGNSKNVVKSENIRWDRSAHHTPKSLTPMESEIFKFIFLQFWDQIWIALEKLSTQSGLLFKKYLGEQGEK